MHIKIKKITKLKKLLFFFVFISGVIFFSSVKTGKVSNTTYYVDNSCLNNGDGTSQNCALSPGASGPFNSLANARSKAGGYSSDDKILLKKGEVFNEKMIFPSSGTTGHPIIIGSYGSGEKPVINGSNIINDWTTVVSHTQLDSNLVGLWNMEEADGVRFDSSAAGNNLSSSGTGRSSLHKQGLYSAMFDRTNSQFLYKDSGLNSTFPGSAANTSFTAGAWVNIKAGNSTNTLSIIDVPYNWYLRKQAGTDKIEAGIWGTAGAYGPIYSNDVIPFDEWVHLVIRYDSPNLFSMFINGVQQTQTVSVPNLKITGNGFFVGSYSYAASTKFDGLIDETFVFNRSLSDAEVLGIYNDGVVVEGVPTGVYSKSVGSQVDNVFEDGFLLSRASSSSCADGNWYWDSVSKTLYYKPTSGLATDHTVGYVQPYMTNVGAIDVSNRSNITIDGIKFINFNSGILGIDSSAANNNITVQNCDFSNGVNAITFTAGANGVSTNGKILNNYFYRVARAVGAYVATGSANYRYTGWDISNNEMNEVGTYDGKNHWQGVVDYEAIGTQNFQNSIISNNYIHDGDTRGVFLYGNSGGICSGNIITRNRFHNTKAPAFLTMGDGAWAWSANVFSYNILWNTGNPINGTNNSFAMHIDQGTGNKTTNFIINNVIYGGSQDLVYFYRGAALYLSMQNNIIGNFSRSAITVSSVNGAKTNLVVNYNIYDTDGGFYYNDAWRNLAYIKSTAKWENNGLISDPKFANAATGNFTLLSTSPAIDRGVNLGNAYKMGLSPNSSDLLDQTANSSTWDIGPYVYNEPLAPIISNVLPTGTLAATTTSVTLSLTTNKAATCRYATSSKIYEAMTNNFKATSGVSHTATISGLVNGTVNQYYVRCIDSKMNANLEDYIISFTIAPLNTNSSGGANKNSGGGSSSGATTINHNEPSQFSAQIIGNDVELKWENSKSSNFSKTLLYRTTNPVSNPSFEVLNSKEKLIYEGTGNKFIDKNIKSSLPVNYYLLSKFGDGINSTIISKNIAPTNNSSTNNSNTSNNGSGDNQDNKSTSYDSEVKIIVSQKSSVKMDASPIQLYDRLFKNNKEKVAVLTQENRYAIALFIQTGTESVYNFGAGERAGILNSYAKAFGKLPRTEAEWQDLIKSAKGRWPTERNKTAEENAKLVFKKIYKRDIDTNNKYDNNAISVIAYGLRPQSRNFTSEKNAIKSFKIIFGYNPGSASDWDIVRAIAYSGAKR